MKILEIEEEHVRRRIERAQRAVERQRTGRERLAHALRQYDLHDVAIDDVLLGAAHRGLERVLAEAGDGRQGRARRLGWNLHRFAQPGEQRLESGNRVPVCARHTGLGVHHQRQLARQVIDNCQFLGQQQHDVRCAERIGLVDLAQLGFDVAHGVVTEQADQPAAKPRQSGHVRHLEARIELGDECHRVGIVAPFGDAIAGDRQHRATIHRNAGSRSEPDEGIAAEALAALHGFEQVGVWRVGQLDVDRQRRVEIGKGLERHRDAVVAQTGEAIELGFVDHDSTATLNGSVGSPCAYSRTGRKLGASCARTCSVARARPRALHRQPRVAASES